MVQKRIAGDRDFEQQEPQGRGNLSLAAFLLDFRKVQDARRSDA